MKSSSRRETKKLSPIPEVNYDSSIGSYKFSKIESALLSKLKKVREKIEKDNDIYINKEHEELCYYYNKYQEVLKKNKIINKEVFFDSVDDGITKNNQISKLESGKINFELLPHMYETSGFGLLAFLYKFNAVSILSLEKSIPTTVFNLPKTHFEKSQIERAEIIQKELRSENAIIQQLLEYGFTNSHSKKILKSNSQEIIINAIKAVDIQVLKGKVKNAKAMLIKAIEEQWHPEKYRDRNLKNAS